MKIFISYRRADSPNISGRIYDRLVSDFGADNIFKDVDNIPLGVDFAAYLNEQINACDVVIAVIGRQWLTLTDEEGNRRITNEADFVRIEIASALKANIPVVPVFVNGITALDSSMLPPSLNALPKQNGIPVRPDPDFHKDMERLITGLEYYTGPTNTLASNHPAKNPEPAVPESKSKTLSFYQKRGLSSLFFLGSFSALSIYLIGAWGLYNLTFAIPVLYFACLLAAIVVLGLLWSNKPRAKNKHLRYQRDMLVLWGSGVLLSSLVSGALFSSEPLAWLMHGVSNVPGTFFVGYLVSAILGGLLLLFFSPKKKA